MWCCTRRGELWSVMRRLIAVVLLSLLFCPSARAQTAQVNEATYGTTWSTLKIGGGGFVTGIDIASDGTKVVRTDTYGAWLYNTATNLWQQLVTASSMPV